MINPLSVWMCVDKFNFLSYIQVRLFFIDTFKIQLFVQFPVNNLSCPVVSIFEQLLSQFAIFAYYIIIYILLVILFLLQCCFRPP